MEENATPGRRRAGRVRVLAALCVLVPAACAPGDPPAGEDAGPVAVELTEWALRLSADSVASGTVVLRIANTGTLQHSVAVEGNGIQELSNHVSPGGSATLVVELSPGTYRVYCPVKESGDHDRLGMHAELVVR